MQLPYQLPYIEPAFGKHALPMNRERNRLDAALYASRGCLIFPGQGLHRRNPYAHLSYTVTTGKAA